MASPPETNWRESIPAISPLPIFILPNLKAPAPLFSFGDKIALPVLDTNLPLASMSQLPNRSRGCHYVSCNC